MATPSDHDHGGGLVVPSSRRERARLLAVAILAAVAAIFAVVNLDEVRVDLIFGSTTMPLIVVIVACLLIGAALGAVAGRRRARRGG